MSASRQPVVYGEYELILRLASPKDDGYLIRRHDADGHRRTVAFVLSLAEWNRFVAALEAGKDEVAAVHAIDEVQS